MPRTRTGESKPDREPKRTAPKKPRPHTRVAEARLAYRADEPDHSRHYAVTRLSSKNQITLPVAMVRDLGMKPGDEINLRLLDDTIYVSRRPQTPDEWIAKFRGSMHVPGWGSREEIDEYIRGERDSWTREGDDF